MSSRRLEAYVGALVAVAVSAGLLLLPRWPITDIWPMLALLGLTIALANMEIELPFAVSLSFIFASVFAGVLYAGPTGGGLLGMAGAVSIQEIRDRKSPVLLLGNLSQLFLAGLGAGWAFVLLGGIPVQLGGSLPRTLEGGLLAPAVAVVVFFVLNLVLVGVAVVLRNGVGIREAVRILNPSSYWISLLVLALLGYVMVQLIALASWVGLLLLVLPFTMARRTFRVYVELSEAFTETVRSLVTAIEAKDPYTRGHSERVAVYSRRLGEDAGLMTAELEVLERAALLHDVGKIGISLSTLTSSEQLTAEEVREIRQHPVLGAELVEDVEFLSALVPIIRHHHERFDGAGYPDGLAGEQIPVLSRILAAADCYDAMTSDRAYRPRLSGEAALLEMERVAGSQLDADCVERLANLVREEPGVAS